MSERSRLAGRQERFSELLGRHGDRAYHFAFRLAGNEQDARDLVQEAFLKAFERLDDYDASKSFDAWLGTILHNIFVDGVRRLSHRESVSLDAEREEEGSSLADILPEAAPSPLERLQRSESRARLQQALALLEPEMRAAVVLCDMEGLSYEEVSGVLDCPVGTVRSRLARGRTKLRSLLETYWKAEEEGHGSA